MDYRPNESVLEKIKQVTFVAVVGPTSVGKTTLINAAAASSNAIHPVVAETSRPPRPGEKEGLDFNFHSHDEIMSGIIKGEYVQAVMHPSGDMYASRPEAYSSEGVAVMAVMADVIPGFLSLPFKEIRVIYVLPPNWDEWQRRLKDHGYADHKIAKRMDEARDSLVFALESASASFVVNDDLAAATTEFTQLALGAKSSAGRGKSRSLAQELLDNITK